MPEATSTVLDDVYSFLDGLVTEGASTDTARERLVPLRARHPGTDIDIVWEEQAFDGSLQFDALIRPDASRTISLSVCPHRALPWPLRGLQRWKDSDLVRVNGVVLSVADAVTQLDMLWEREPLMQRLIDRCLIDEALERDPVEVSDAEIQRAFDAMRRGRRLLSTADLDAWMKDTGTSLQVLESMAMQLARVAKLRERTVGHRVDDALKGDLSRFDWVSLATVSAHRSEAIDAVREEARRGGLGLLHAAQCVFVQGGNERYETQLGRLRRHQLDDALQHAISEVTSGCNGNDENRVLGPLDTGERFMLAEVLALEAARPDDPELRRLVATQLFDDWLCDRRRHAKIEWFWGRA